MLTDFDHHLLGEGTHYRLHEKLGAHLAERDGVAGVRFAVWAPKAREVSVIGDFNGWQPGVTPLARQQEGLWEGFVPGLKAGERYKYRVASKVGGRYSDKADPFAFHTETPPHRASVVWDLRHDWEDEAWMASRAARSGLHAPVSIYEVHPGSWRRGPGGRYLSYRELAPLLVEYVQRMGFTHVELMPVMEHPFYGSWGYQVTSYFAPTSRQGTPQDLMFLIDALHQAHIGVILDWVPSHFPTDEHGLGYFDGTHLFEHADPRLGFHPDWNSFIFDYSRPEVRAFLISSARFWLERYHADGLRVDAVASMLYLDYSRGPGGWVPNRHGGRENLDAIALLRAMNEELYQHFPGVQIYAEESTAWPMVSRPLYVGGLGFGYKWDMGWMNDTLAYLARDPIFRSYAHNQLTFRPMYAASENFVLPLSHDEVVHGKGSLLGRMPGDRWQRFANLRLLLANQHAQPGKKLLFMGGEFGQLREWNHDAELDWQHLEDPLHLGVQRLTRDLNQLYGGQPAMHEGDCSADGFEWVDCSDAAASIVAFLRRGTSVREQILVVFNYTPILRENYRIGVPHGGRWQELINTDASAYGGSGVGNLGGVEAERVEQHGRRWSIRATLPPLGALFFKGVDVPPEEPEPRPSTELELTEELSESAWPDTPAKHPRHTPTLLPPRPAADEGEDAPRAPTKTLLMTEPPPLPALPPSLTPLRRLSEATPDLWLVRHETFAVEALVKLGAPSDEERRRFQRVWSLSFRLRSPHALRIFEHGLTAHGAPFLVQELLDGLDLERALASAATERTPTSTAPERALTSHTPGRTLTSTAPERALAQGRSLPPQEVLTLGRQLARCLGAAHEQGISHGSLRPRDVFLCAAADGDPFIKLLGFGRASPQDGDPAGDLRALGRLLFAALGGRPQGASEAPLLRWVQRSDGGAFASALELYNSLHDALEQAPPRRREIPLRHRLPNPAPLFLGRSAELERLADLLREGPLALLQGPSGAGTTALAVQAIHRHFPGRTATTLRVSLQESAGHESPALSILRAVVRLAGLDGFDWSAVAGSPDALVAAAIDLVESEGRWVFVEDLHLAPPEQAAHLLQQIARHARGGRWLFSSCRLLRGEHLIGRIISLPPLAEEHLDQLALASRPELDEPQRRAAVARSRGCPGALLRLLFQDPGDVSEDPGAERSLAGLLQRCGGLPEPLARGCAEALSPLGARLLDNLERRGLIRWEREAVALLAPEASSLLQQPSSPQGPSLPQQSSSLQEASSLLQEAPSRLQGSPPLLPPETLRALSTMLEGDPEPRRLLVALELRLEARDHGGARALLDRVGARLLAQGYAAELYGQLQRQEAPELDHPRLSCAVQLGDTAALTAPAPRSRAPEDQLLWATLLLARNEIPGALAALDRLLPGPPPAPGPLAPELAFEIGFLRARCLANSNQPAAAVAALRGLAPPTPGSSARTSSLLAAIQAGHGARDEALQAVEQARASLAQLPERERKRVAAGVVHTLYVLGQLRDADEVLERCFVAPSSTRLDSLLEREPARLDAERHARYLRAVVAAELGDLDGAERLLDQLFPYLGPTSLLRPYVHLLRGWVLATRGQLPALDLLLDELRASGLTPELSDGVEALALSLKILRRQPPEDTAPSPEVPWASNLRHLVHARRLLHRARWGALSPRDALQALERLPEVTRENALVGGIARATCQLLAGDPQEAARLATAVAEDAAHHGFAQQELDARSLRGDALLCAGHAGALRAATAELRALARRVRSPRYEAMATFHEVLASPERIDAASIEGLCSMEPTAPDVALRAQALMGARGPADQLDQAVHTAILTSGRWQAPRLLGRPSEGVPGWGLDEERREVWLPDGRRVSFQRHETLWRLLSTLAACGGTASKEMLTREVWGEASYHPLLHDNRLQAAIRKIRLRIEEEPSTPRRLLTTDDGYALGGNLRRI